MFPKAKKWVVPLLWAGFIMGCASTDIIESPKTVYVPESSERVRPEIIWTSQRMTRPFDYLGVVKVRSFTYDGALERLVEGGSQLHADALIDVHFQRIGFLNAMEAFAVKFK